MVNNEIFMSTYTNQCEGSMWAYTWATTWENYIYDYMLPRVTFVLVLHC